MDFDSGKMVRLGVMLGGVLLGLLILFISITRASLMVTILLEKESNLRKTPVRLLERREDGSVEVISYRLPQVRTLPISPLYRIKNIRDIWWVKLCRLKKEKVIMVLLQADKKIAESRILFAGSYPNLAFESAEKAISKLKYAAELLEEVEDDEVEKRHLNLQIYRAGLVYKKILLQVEGSMDIDKERYQQIMNDLNKWNEKQKEKRESIN